MEKLDVVLTRNECLQAILNAARRKVENTVANLDLSNHQVERALGIVLPASAETAVVTLAPLEVTPVDE